MKNAMIGAMAGAGITIMGILIFKGLSLKKRGAYLKGELEQKGGLMKAAVEAQGASIRQQISDEAKDYAEQLASDTGKQYLMQTFGLNESRLNKIKQYGRVLGI